MIKLIIAIDPGKSGGISMMVYDFQEKKAKGFETHKMPPTVQSLSELVKGWEYEYPGSVAFVEKLSMFPGDSDHPGKAFMLQKMHKSFNEIVTTLKLAGIKVFEVTPMSWQSFLKLRQRGVKETKTQRKNKYKAHAKVVFPFAQKITLDNSDSLCILDYARRKMEMDLRKYV